MTGAPGGDVTLHAAIAEVIRNEATYTYTELEAPVMQQPATIETIYSDLAKDVARTGRRLEALHRAEVRAANLDAYEAWGHAAPEAVWRGRQQVEVDREAAAGHGMWTWPL